METNNRTEKIVDVGEKIAGARKDILKTFSSMLEDVTRERLSANPLSRILKKLNLKRAVESGALREIDAIFYDALFSSINVRKPSVGWADLARKRRDSKWRTRLDVWVDDTYDALMRLKRFVRLDVKGRDGVLKELVAKRFVNIAEDRRRAREIRNIDGSKPRIGKRYTPNPIYVKFEILKRFGHRPGAKVTIPFDLIIPDVTLNRYTACRRAAVLPFAPEDDLDAVIDYIVCRMKAPSDMEDRPDELSGRDGDSRSPSRMESQNRTPEKKLKYCGVTPTALLSVFSSWGWGHGGCFRVVETNRCFKSPLKEFSSREDAFKWRNKIKDSYFQIWKEGKIGRKGISFAYSEGARRIGEDRRSGRNMGAEDFMNAFGFRGVQFGNWTHQIERQKFVNQAYDAFVDLAELIGVEPRSLSLNNELGLAFGARGLGRSSAHYEHGEVVINLTKTRGAGSLAHEWWHALDNYFARKAGVKYGMVSEDEQIRIPDGVRNAFTRLTQKLSKSDYAARSRVQGAYWKRMSEMTARFFAEWIVMKQRKRGCFNSFLASGVSADKLIEFNYGIYCRQMQIAQVRPVPFDEFRMTNRAYEGFPYPNEMELIGYDDELNCILAQIALVQG